MNRQSPVITLSLVIALVQSLLAAQQLPAPVNRAVDFDSEVQPLLVKHCAECHGSTKQESGFRVDRREAAMLGGDSGLAIKVGNSAESKLIHYVAALDPDKVMPPDGPRLSEEAVGVLRAWIDAGAHWPDSHSRENAASRHWAYQPIQLEPPPQVTRADWSTNPIDRFVLAKLESLGISPSEQADRHTLIRRLSLDLIGLLPSIDEVDTFVTDASPEAYEALVDRLLASPHFGERWGRHWLDMARYADSDGYEKDNPRPDAYRYRDWVIDAINSDMPFDQFTVEQLAGDLLSQATDMQHLATAFHRQTLTNTEGGTDQEQFRVEACFDRTETTGAIWLGLTVGCARCHTHKYDAISQREYYQLFAFFNNGDEQTHVVPKSRDEVIAYQAAKARHDAELFEANTQLAKRQSQLGPALTEWESEASHILAEAESHPLIHEPFTAACVTSNGHVEFKTLGDKSFLAHAENPESVDYVVSGKISGTTMGVLRLDVLPDASLPAKGPGRVKHGNFVLSEIACEVSESADFSASRNLEFIDAKADFEQVDKPWLAKNAIDGNDDTGWAIGPLYGKEHWAEFQFKPSGDIGKPLFIRITLRQRYGKQHTIGRFKLGLQSHFTPAVNLPENVAKALATPRDQRSENQRYALLEHFSRLDPAAKAHIDNIEKIKKNAPPKPELAVRVLAQRTQQPRPTYVLRRGEFLEPLVDSAVAPAGLSILARLQSRVANQPADRLDLAYWLVSKENVLTPRVTVNHVWRILFGNGIVKTSNDFGVRGDLPTHPELLDWLAANFIGLASQDPANPKTWSRKSLIKLIVMSATYRQSSKQRSDLRESDPHNRLLARQSRLRVEGEIVRDISLDVADLLSPTIGGPSVFPALPPGVAELSYSGNFKWTPSEGADHYRRGMYTFFKRTSPHPNLITFDCPDANLTCIDRNRSNTPLQALIALNNDSFAEAARGLAKRVLELNCKNKAEGVETAFRLCVARPPNEFEKQKLLALLENSQDWYVDHPEDAKSLAANTSVGDCVPAEVAAWVATARILINLDEFITRE